MNVFIKPTSTFQEAQFQGSAEIVGGGKGFWTFQVGESKFQVREGNWDRAVENDQWIKLSEGRCTLWDEDKIPKITPQQFGAKFDESLIRTTKLSDIPLNPELYRPIKTGTFIDEFWSRKGGILPGTITMITGDPGIGKSSVMMDILQGVKSVNPEKSVLFVSAEMTRVDMMDPDEFMKYYPGLFDKVEFLFAGDYLDNEEGPSFSKALEVILGRGYDIAVFDSMIEVQSICQAEMGLGSGKTAEKFMLNLMQAHVQAQNAKKCHSAFLLIQQVKKDGEFVGSRRLEHMITSFLSIKWDIEVRGKKYMEFRKNRRGDVKKRLYFKFGPVGIIYDETKFQDEIRLTEILEKDQNLVEELNDDQLVALLSGRQIEEE